MLPGKFCGGERTTGMRALLSPAVNVIPPNCRMALLLTMHFGGGPREESWRYKERKAFFRGSVGNSILLKCNVQGKE